MFSLFNLKQFRRCTSLQLAATYRCFSSTPFPDKIFIRKEADYPDGLPLRYFMRSGYFPNYWKVAKAMQKRSMIPILHGQHQFFRISYEVLKALGFQNGELLRVPTPEFFEEGKKVQNEIFEEQEKIQKNLRFYRMLHNLPMGFLLSYGKIDHPAKFSSYLLSANIGMDGVYSESALSFVFGGPVSKYDFDLAGNRTRLFPGKVIERVDLMISQGMKMRGFSQKRINQLTQNLARFHIQAANLNIGQLIVIGIPIKQISKWTYSSHAFGVENRISTVSKILKDLSLEKDTASSQLRLLLTEETLHPQNGIQVINLMDEEAVAAFCTEKKITPPEEDEVLKEYLKNIEFERKGTIPITTFAKELRETIEEQLSLKQGQIPL